MRDIDAIVERLILDHPSLKWEQLAVSHPGADDDGIWFFRHPSSPHEVQLESTSGMCPFLFETSGPSDPMEAANVEAAIELVIAGLGLKPPQPGA